MDLFDARQGRKSIRRFKETPPVPAEDINKILDAGRWAPSAHDTQPWSFMVIRNRAVI
jgi:coenzyme F420-0:L-glutamate ligase / coenzyme F420-1:gamma-L-glutamate ligase